MKTTRYTSDYSYSVIDTLKGVFQDYKSGWNLAIRLAKRDIKAQYRQSILGLGWVVIIPLVSTLLWVLLQQQGVIKVEGLNVPYIIFALTGIVLWQLFVESLNSTLNIFKQSKSLLSKINFPRESLIIAGVLKVMFNFLIKFTILIIIMVYYQIFPVNYWYLFPIGIVSITLLGVSMGILITPMGVLYNDVQQFIQTFVRLFFFLTPIIYVPAADGLLAKINEYNPVGIIVCTTREWLINADVITYGGSIWWVLGASVFLFLLASVVYRTAMPIIIERMGS